MIVWIAAYALAFQTVLVPLLAAPMQVSGPDGAQLFALCLASKAAGSQASTDIPAGNHDPDTHCKLCVHGALTFAETSAVGTAWVEPHTSMLLRWAAIGNPIPDSARPISEHARGPPLPA